MDRRQWSRQEQFQPADQNVDISLNCIRLASELSIKKVVLPGSTNEYLYYGKPIEINAAPSPGSAYGR